MNNRAFSLIELVIIIALIGILSTLATFEFSKYSTKSRITNQTRLLYGDLMTYRTKALYEKRNWTFKISATGYGIYSSAVTSVAPVTTVTLGYGVTSDTSDDVMYTTQGVVVIPGSSKSVCISQSNEASVDAVVISPTWIKIGKKREGADCASANIDTK